MQICHLEYNSLNLMYKKNYVLNTPPPNPLHFLFNIYILFSFLFSFLYTCIEYVLMDYKQNKNGISVIMKQRKLRLPAWPLPCFRYMVTRSLKFLVTLGMQTCDFNPWKYAALNWLGDILILLYMCKKETSSFYRSHLISENLVFLNEVFCIYIKVSSCTGLKKSLNLFILQFD